MNEVKVSVIMPVYNSEKYLEKCISSVLNQSLREIELICVDDGSTDSSPRILEAFAKSDSRVKSAASAKSLCGRCPQQRHEGRLRQVFCVLGQ